MVLTWLAHAPFRTSFTPSPVCNTTLGMTRQFPKAVALPPVASRPREGQRPPQKTRRVLGQLLQAGLRIPSSPPRPRLALEPPQPPPCPLLLQDDHPEGDRNKSVLRLCLFHFAGVIPSGEGIFCPSRAPGIHGLQ